MSNDSAEGGHGSSPAAWTAVTIMIIGVAIGTLFLFLNVMTLVYVGAGVVVVGALVGLVLKKAGFGVGGSRLRSSH